MHYESTCFSNYTYESEDTADNILENKLSYYEARMGAVIKYILNHFIDEDFVVTKEKQEFIYLYMHLQYLRTDAGRINFMTMYEDIFTYIPRTLPLELEDIQNNREKVTKFNKIFKQDGVLENYLNNLKKPDNMNFHIAISDENLLTSDNPVIGTDMWKRMILPISPFLAIEFTDNSIDEAQTMLVRLTPVNL